MLSIENTFENQMNFRKNFNGLGVKRSIGNDTLFFY